MNECLTKVHQLNDNKLWCSLYLETLPVCFLLLIFNRHAAPDEIGITLEMGWNGRYP